MATFNLTGEYSIRQGATYDIATFYYPEDISDWTPRGQIRKLPHSPVLAEFSFLPLTFTTVTLPDQTTGDRTVIVPILSASQTTLLPTTSLFGSLTVEGFNVWCYDIELESPIGKVIKLSSGQVKVISEVTHI